jgi:hypothetical protein
VKIAAWSPKRVPLASRMPASRPAYRRDRLQDTQVESKEVVAERIRRGLEVMPPDRLCVMTDCGLGYFSRTMAYAKLTAMVEGRDTVLQEVAGGSRPQPVAAV